VLRSGSDEVLYRINPIQVATQKSIIRRTSHLALQASAPDGSRSARPVDDQATESFAARPQQKAPAMPGL
jgi:hypothetical protein